MTYKSHQIIKIFSTSKQRTLSSAILFCIGPVLLRFVEVAWTKSCNHDRQDSGIERRGVFGSLSNGRYRHELFQGNQRYVRLAAAFLVYLILLRIAFGDKNNLTSGCCIIIT